MEFPLPTPPVVYPAGKKELLFGLGIGLSGMFLVNSVLFGGFNLGFAIGVILCLACSCVYLLFSGRKPTVYSITVLLLCMVIAAAFARSDDGFVKVVLVCFLLLGINLGLSLLAGKNRRDPGSAASLLDAFFCFFTLGFGGMPPALRGLRNTVRSNGPAAQKGSAVLLGLGIALPVLLIIVPLLVKADAAFEGLLNQLPGFDLAQLLSTVLFGTAFALILYARGVSLTNYVNQPLTPRAAKGLSPVTVNTLLGAVCFVYCVYLASQLAYFAGGFSGILPAEFTLAEYARRGFFEMAWLCAINLSIMIFGLSLCGKKDPTPRSTRLLCLFIGVVTLFFVAAASAKMLLYIENYGLTRLRVLTQVIMVFLAVVTVLVSLWLFLPKLSYMKGIVLTALILGGGVLWADVDTQVAKFNVNAYLSGQMATVDVTYLRSLGDGAVPYIARLAREAKETSVAEDANRALNRRLFRKSEDFRGWNYVNHIAGTLLPETSRLGQSDILFFREVGGVIFPLPLKEDSTDSHGGFLGDGLLFSAAYYSPEEGAGITEQLQSGTHWHSFPLPDSINKLLYGETGENYIFYAPLSMDGRDVPQVENGYYFFFDRHTDSTDPYDAGDIFYRGSLNFNLAIYDTDTHTLYYWEMDT